MCSGIALPGTGPCPCREVLFPVARQREAARNSRVSHRSPNRSALQVGKQFVRVASMRFQPCFRAVDRTLRNVAKSRAPCSKRNPPEIFMRSFIIRRSCSARLFANGTAKSIGKRSTDSLRRRSRRARLCPGLEWLRNGGQLRVRQVRQGGREWPHEVGGGWGSQAVGSGEGGARRPTGAWRPVRDRPAPGGRSTPETQGASTDRREGGCARGREPRSRSRPAGGETGAAATGGLPRRQDQAPAEPAPSSRRGGPPTSAPPASSARTPPARDSPAPNAGGGGCRNPPGSGRSRLTPARGSPTERAAAG